MSKHSFFRSRLEFGLVWGVWLIRARMRSKAMHHFYERPPKTEDVLAGRKDRQDHKTKTVYLPNAFDYWKYQHWCLTIWINGDLQQPFIWPPIVFSPILSFSFWYVAPYIFFLTLLWRKLLTRCIYSYYLVLPILIMARAMLFYYIQKRSPARRKVHQAIRKSQ